MHTNLRLGLALLGIGILAPAFAAAPAFQRNDSIGVVLGDSIDYHLVAAGENLQFAATGLPAGLSLNPTTGEITGTPADVGRSNVAVSASNADGTATATLSIAVVDPAAGPLIYAPLEFDAYNEPQPGGDTFSCVLRATGAPSTFAVSDALPTGWSLVSSTIVGSTTQPGLFVLPVTATNANGIGSAVVTVRVHPACTQVEQTPGKLQPGNVFTVTLQFNRAVGFSGTAPYLEFSTYPDGTIHRMDYVSGNGTTTFVFAYTVTGADSPGDITLSKAIQPSVNGAVTGLVDQDGLTLGSSLPLYGPGSPVASIVTPTPSAPVGNAAASSTVASNPATSTAVTTAAATVQPVLPATAASATGGAATTPPAFVAATTTAAATADPTTTTSASVASSRLLNLSARGLVSDGDSSRAFIAGFVVSGTAPKRVLVRAIGPSLASFGVQNALANPALRVSNAAGTTVAESDDWSGADTASTSGAVGAFSLPAGSRDAALVITLAPGSYSIQVLSNGGSGVALAEVYDADGSDHGTLINLSSRGFVGGGEDVLTAGFVIGGDSPKRVLVRGVGPSLAQFGVGTPLANPVLKVYQGSTVVAQNDDWESGQATSAADVSGAAGAVGSFQLAAGSHDAATVLTLPPGVYSAVIGSADGSEGAALAEVYQL